MIDYIYPGAAIAILDIVTLVMPVNAAKRDFPTLCKILR